MPKSRQEEGASQHVDRRTGVGSFKGWKGIERNGGPASIGDDHIWNGQNVRSKDGIYVTRGGQAKVNASNISEIQGFYDALDIGDAATRTSTAVTISPLIASGGSCGAAGSQKLYIVIGGADAGTARVWSWDGATLGVVTDANAHGYTDCMCSLGTCLIVGVDRYDTTVKGALRRVSAGAGTMSGWVPDITLSLNDKVDNLLYLSSDGGTDRLLIGVTTGQSYVLSTNDGVNFVLEFTAPTFAGSGQEMLLAKDPTTGQAYIATARLTGVDGVGLWTRNAGGTVYTEIPRNTPQPMNTQRRLAVTSTGRVFLMGYRQSGQTGAIWTYPGLSDGTKMEEAATIGPFSSGADGVTAFAEFGGLFVFGYANSGGSAILCTATITGGSFNLSDNVYDFTSNFGSDSLLWFLGFIQYGTDLYALLRSNATRTYLYKTVGASLTSWAKVGEVFDADGTGNSSVAINQHMVVA